jgi:hypothetical protein
MRARRVWVVEDRRGPVDVYSGFLGGNGPVAETTRAKAVRIIERFCQRGEWRVVAYVPEKEPRR